MAEEQQEFDDKLAEHLSAIMPKQTARVKAMSLRDANRHEIAEKFGVEADTVSWHLTQADNSIRAAEEALEILDMVSGYEDREEIEDRIID